MEPTFEQKRTIRELRQQYGREDNLMISLSGNGVVRMDWKSDPVKTADILGQERHLFILPNGQRMGWKQISV